MRHTYKITITINHHHGQEHIEYLAIGRKDAANRIKHIMDEYKLEGLSFVIIITKLP